MTAAEEILFDKARQIALTWDRERELNANEKLILQQAVKIMIARFFDYFTMMFKFLIPDRIEYCEFMIGFLRLSTDTKKWFKRMEHG